MHEMPELYGAAAARELDRRLIQDAGMSGYRLMQQAAAACWRALRDTWPAARAIAVVCGGGNNGGDGFEIARLARAAGCRVQLLEVFGRQPTGDAALARRAWCEDGGVCVPWTATQVVDSNVDVIVDAIFGTGLSRAPTGAAAAAIGRINALHGQGRGVLAVDVPSGLDIDHGTVPGTCVEADVTVTFIGRKFGLHTGAGPDCAGHVVFDALVAEPFPVERPPAQAQLMDAAALRTWLPQRRRGAHKGDHGHVLIVGGDHGMAGAVLMAARAALRAGAGLVTVATRSAHAAILVAAQPEVMFHAVEEVSDLAPLLENATAVAIGPGFGQSPWAQTLWRAVQGFPRLVVDADALNLLARAPVRNTNWILTPHPGEAARLLSCSTREIQHDRAAALASLVARYGGFPVLKGAGSLVWNGHDVLVCPYGNPGMGVGGMGDALTGIVAAFLAQRLAMPDAAAAGVLAHALAGDVAAAGKERGLLPTDLINHLRGVVNP
ncbi:MAG: NAD(P)H-hydrate dehydratase [Nevskiaceae bacterium]|nr:MAG: NAD(P)H-hydrate dehydratase [Nevskiaceae bacterium]TBR71763.1 MAG: NAD(P)H-hydrate dehydratase [Nevskiaceae bacterium]